MAENPSAPTTTPAPRPPRLLLPFAAQLFGAFLLFLVVVGGIISMLWPTIETLVITESRCFITQSAASVGASTYPVEHLYGLPADLEERRRDDTLRRLQRAHLGSPVRPMEETPTPPGAEVRSGLPGPGVVASKDGDFQDYLLELSIVAPTPEGWVVLISSEPALVGTVVPFGNYLSAYAAGTGGWDNFVDERGRLQIFSDTSPARLEALERRRAEAMSPPLTGLNSAIDPITSARPLGARIDPAQVPAWMQAQGVDLTKAAFVASMPHDRAMATVRELRPFFRGLVIGACVVALIGALIVTWRMNRPLRRLDDTINRVVGGDLAARVQGVRSHDEFGRVAWQFNRMMDELAKGRELSGSLAVASRIQRELIPDPPADVEGLDISAWYKPSSDIGGDYYDFVRKGRHLWLVVGDAVGHGVDSGLIMASARSMVRALIELKDTPSEVMTALNALLSRDFRNGNFLTCAILRIDLESGSAALCSAGHEPVLHVSGPLRTVRIIKSNGPPLGLFEGMVYRDGPLLELRQDDLLVLASDGIRECHNEEGQLFGMERLSSCAAAHVSTAEDVVNRIRKDVLAFAGQRPVDDDVSLVVARFHGGAAGSSWGQRR
jgi:serine phosphatase RsbU (regulator of sigma subunit)